jgi:hypothetical protein
LSDSAVLANAKRQAELEARHRDLTKTIPPPGTDGDSLRAIPGMAGISDEMLDERANFNLKDHMQKTPTVCIDAWSPPRIDLTKLTPEELYGLQNAARTELAQREGAD